jgi:hypothetical protein
VIPLLVPTAVGSPFTNVSPALMESVRVANNGLLFAIDTVIFFGKYAMVTPALDTVSMSEVVFCRNA